MRRSISSSRSRDRCWPIGITDGGRGDALHLLEVDRGAPAPEEALAVEVDRDAVQLDRALERRARERHPALLVGVAEHEHVGGDGVAHQPDGELGGGDEMRFLARHRGCRPAGPMPGSCQFGFFTNSAVGVTLALTTARVRVVRHLGDRFGARGDHEVAAEHQARAAGVEARGVHLLRASRRPARATSPRRTSAPGRTCRAPITPLPSRCAATPRIWPMVMTPVPPMPVTRMP